MTILDNACICYKSNKQIYFELTLVFTLECSCMSLDFFSIAKVNAHTNTDCLHVTQHSAVLMSKLLKSIIFTPLNAIENYHQYQEYKKTSSSFAKKKSTKERKKFIMEMGFL